MGMLANCRCVFATVTQLLACVALLVACAPPAVILVDRTPGKETSRAVASLVFRSDQLEYEATFRHDRASGQHYVAIWSRVETSSSAQEPHWIEFSVDGEKHRLQHWSTLQQKHTRAQAEFTCSGMMFRHCGRAPSQVERYVWNYALPDAAVRSFSHMRRGTAILGVSDVAIHLDLAEQRHLIRDFFSATSTGYAYD